MARPALQEGQRLADGRYRLVRQLGAGGMGEVWLAIDEDSGAQVAAKAIACDAAESPEARSKLREEYLRVRKLVHPGI